MKAQKKYWAGREDIAASILMMLASTFGYNDGRVYQIDRQSSLILALLDIAR